MLQNSVVHYAIQTTTQSPHKRQYVSGPYHKALRPAFCHSDLQVSWHHLEIWIHLADSGL